MSEIIYTTNIKREKGYLYFVTSDAKGFLCIGKALLDRSGRKKQLNKEVIKA